LARDVVDRGHEGSENAYKFELKKAGKEVTYKRHRGMMLQRILNNVREVD
jgi:hypothetical protein